MWLVATVLHRLAENLEKLPCCSQRNLEAQEPDNYRQCLYWFARPKNFPLQVDVWKKSCETVILIIGSQSEGGSFTSVRRRRSLWAISVSKEMHVLFSSLAPYTKVRDKFNIGWKQPKKWILCTFPKGEPSTSHHFSWKKKCTGQQRKCWVQRRGAGIRTHGRGQQVRTTVPRYSRHRREAPPLKWNPSTEPQTPIQQKRPLSG